MTAKFNSIQLTKMNPITRISKAVSKLDKVVEGENNFDNGTNDELAEIRYRICSGCPMFQKEPISFLRTDDKAVPGLSGKMCDECGCVLSYKLRLENEKCPLGKW